jgi:hypothetical protein
LNLSGSGSSWEFVVERNQVVGGDMRCTRISLVLSLLFCTSSAWAQLAQQATIPASTPKDPQAVSVLNQALAVSGGTTAIEAVTDYTATGNVTYHWAGKDVQGSVTVNGRGSDQVRVDTNMPGGARSLVTSQGKTSQKAEDGGILQMSIIPPLSPGSLAFPYRLLVDALMSPGLSLSYKGVVQIDGHSAHDLRVQPLLPDSVQAKDLLAELQATDFLIDVSTLQVIMVQDMIRTIQAMTVGHPHEIRLSDYRNVNGVLVPFSIDETIGGQKSWAITLNNITFNSGLADSNFQL